MSFNDVKDAFKTIQERIDILEGQNKRLIREIGRLKDKHYKDKELSTMKSQLEAMQKDYYRGFPISENEQKSIQDWMDKHNEELHNCQSLDDKIRRDGCIGGTYTYEFIPTSIGTIGTVKCSCGAEFTFQNI